MMYDDDGPSDLGLDAAGGGGSRPRNSDGAFLPNGLRQFVEGGLRLLSVPFIRKINDNFRRCAVSVRANESTGLHVIEEMPGHYVLTVIDEEQVEDQEPLEEIQDPISISVLVNLLIRIVNITSTGDNGIHGVKLDTDTFTRANNGIIELIEHSPTSAQVAVKFTLSDNGGNPDPIQVGAYIEKADIDDPGNGDGAGDRFDVTYRVLQKPSAATPETVVLDTRDWRGRFITIGWRSVDFDSTDDPDEELWPLAGSSGFNGMPGAAYTATDVDLTASIRATMTLRINCTTGGGRLELVFTSAIGGPQWTATHIHVQASEQRSGAFDATHEP